MNHVSYELVSQDSAPVVTKQINKSIIVRVCSVSLIMVLIISALLIDFVGIHRLLFREHVDLQVTSFVPIVSAPIHVNWSRFAIVGAAWHQSFSSIIIFVTSARQFCPGCTLILFIDPHNTDDNSVNRNDFFQKYNVTIVFPNNQHNNNNNNINNGRYNWYIDYFQTRLDLYDALFHADVKDTVFQGNIFQDLAYDVRVVMEKRGLIWGFEESRAQTMGNERSHTGWFKQCYGQATFERMKDFYGICSGTILGTTLAMVKHFQAMMELSSSEHTNNCGLIVDQAAHILLFRDEYWHNKIMNHNNSQTEYILESNEKGHKVGTLGMLNQRNDRPLSKNSVEYDKLGNVANDDGIMYLVLHQYYVVPGLDEKFRQIYGV